MKRYVKFIFAMIFVIFIVTNTVFAATDNFTKRIVSVVYDDSWSMADNGQDYAYASYALQNIVGFMNENDELHVVRMSNKTEYQTINLSSKDKKIENITKIAGWSSSANETPFEAIETAIECLKERKSIHGTGDNIEYWLLVLTDGNFEGIPQDPQMYLEGVNDYMSDVKFESIYVFISDKARANLRGIVNNLPNATCIDSADKEGICKALFEAAEKIYGRMSIKGDELSKSGSNVSFDFPFPIGKITVFEQDQNIELKNIASTGTEILGVQNVYSARKTNAPVLISKIVEIKEKNKDIASGKIDMDFESEVDTDEKKFQVMVDTAISFELYPVDDKGNRVTNLNTYGQEDIAEFIARPINTYTGDVVNLGDYVNKSNVKGEYNGQKIDLSYDNNDLCYRFNSNLRMGSNRFSATFELPGYFKSKSNVVDIYVKPIKEISAVIPSIDPNEIKVSAKMTKEYEKVGSINYTLENLKDKTNGALTFTNIPKGIQIKVNGAIVKKDKASTTLNEINSIDIYRNKDYAETSLQNVSVNIDLFDKEIKVKDVGCNFILTPIIRKLTLNVEKLYDDPNKLNSGNAYGRNLYQVTPIVDGENISMQELKESSIEFANVDSKTNLKYKIEEKDGKNVYYVSIKRPLLKLIMGDKSVNATMVFTTPFGEEVSEKISFYIKGNIINDILRLLIPLLIIIWIIGIIKKPRFEKKNHKIIVLQNGKEIHNAPLTVYGGISSIIPFVPQKGKAYDLDVKAADTKKAIIVCKNSLKDGMKYDNDDVSRRKDLKLYEDTFLDYSEGRSFSIRYIYTDVVTNQVDKEIKTSRRGRR